MSRRSRKHGKPRSEPSIITATAQHLSYSYFVGRDGDLTRHPAERRVYESKEAANADLPALRERHNSDRSKHGKSDLGFTVRPDHPELPPVSEVISEQSIQ